MSDRNNTNVTEALRSYVERASTDPSLDKEKVKEMSVLLNRFSEGLLRIRTE